VDLLLGLSDFFSLSLLMQGRGWLEVEPSLTEEEKGKKERGKRKSESHRLHGEGQ
jgi:hypothetical protein